MRFREPVSAYLHFIKTASRRCPDINPNPKRYCEFCGLRPSGLGARDDADADAPAAKRLIHSYLQTPGYVVKTKLHSAISLQPPSPFLSRSPFLPGTFRWRSRTQTNLFVYNYANADVHLNYGTSSGKLMVLIHHIAF